MSDEVLLIVGFEGPIPLVNASVEACTPASGGPRPGRCPRTAVVRSPTRCLLQAGAGVHGRYAFADTMEVAARWDRLPDLYAQVQGALGRHTAVMAHFSHAYQEGCSIYFSLRWTGIAEDLRCHLA